MWLQRTYHPTIPQLTGVLARNLSRKLLQLLLTGAQTRNLLSLPARLVTGAHALSPQK